MVFLKFLVPNQDNECWARTSKGRQSNSKIFQRRVCSRICWGLHSNVERIQIPPSKVQQTEYPGFIFFRVQASESIEMVRQKLKKCENIFTKLCFLKEGSYHRMFFFYLNASNQDRRNSRKQYTSRQIGQSRSSDWEFEALSL